LSCGFEADGANEDIEIIDNSLIEAIKFYAAQIDVNPLGGSGQLISISGEISPNTANGGN
jgi:hypothetical protein